MARALCSHAPHARHADLACAFLAALCSLTGCGAPPLSLAGDGGVTGDASTVVVEDAGEPDGGAGRDGGAAHDGGARGLDAGSAPGALVEELGGASCEPDGSAPPGSSCRVLRVACGGLAPLEVELRDAPPLAGAGAGVVLLGSGGSGQRWSGGYRGVIRALRESGYRVLERRWLGESVAGWIAGGMGPGACRYAALVRWIDDNVRAGDEPLCVSGNSGGAGEIGAALARHDLESLVDLAILSSGPMARLDYACGREAEWAPSCAELVAPHPWTCAAGAPSCGTLRDGERALFDAAHEPVIAACSDPTPEHLALLQSTSPIAPGSDVDFDTDVRIFLGSEDCSIAPSHGLLYASLTTARGAPIPLEVVAGAPHELPGSPTGQPVLIAALRAGCVRR